MNPETDLICLQIVKGIPKAPGDTESADIEIVTMDLLDVNGLSVQPDGWSLQLPGIKRGGTWADTQLSDGRTLIAAAKENVIETMQLAIGNQDLRQRYQIMAKLQRMADDAREFWASGYQREPVYLKFKANGARVFQYALIYDLTIAQDSDPYEIAEGWKITITIEREVAWRMVVPPGGNPLEYWFWTQGKVRGVDYTFTDLKLGQNTDHFFYGEPDNAQECDGADFTTFLTKPWIDIDGSTIPGDAPALMYLAFQITLLIINQLYVARRTEPRRRYSRFADEYYYQSNVVCAGDTTTVGAYTIDACGVRCQKQTANRYIVTDTIPAGPDADFAAGVEDLLYWSFQNTDAPPLPENMMQGNWGLYLRCQQTDGAQGDVEVRARVQLGDFITGGVEKTLPASFMPYRVPDEDCEAEFDIVYLGTISIPGVDSTLGALEGYGYRNFQDVWSVRIDVRNLSAATRDLEFLDLWFMPLDEGFCIANPAETKLKGAGGQHATLSIDNTGYALHGRPDDVCVREALVEFPTESTTDGIQPIPLLGSALTLKPGVDNRIIFLQRYIDLVPLPLEQTYSPAVPAAVTEGPVRINIVPRCYGIADL